MHDPIPMPGKAVRASVETTAQLAAETGTGTTQPAAVPSTAGTLRKPAPGTRRSKGPRHTFVVKPDLERAAKLLAIIEILNTNAVDYLTPLVGDHIDSIDLDELRRLGASHTPETS